MDKVNPAVSRVIKGIKDIRVKNEERNNRIPGAKRMVQAMVVIKP